MNVIVGGCGWLGLQIGKALIEDGHQVYGTYRSDHARMRLEENQIRPVFYDFLDEKSQISLENIDLVIFSLPPIKREITSFYGESLMKFLRQLQAGVRVFFSSSTGVYPQKSGVYNESYVFEATEMNNCIVHAEKYLLELLGDRLNVLRFGGLIGRDRHPIRSLSGRELVGNGNVTVNLIHANDIVELMRKMIKDPSSGTFNVVYPISTSKRGYYEEAASKLGYSAPIFGTIDEPDRVITNERLSEIKGFRLSYSPEDWTQFTEIQQI